MENRVIKQLSTLEQPYFEQTVRLLVDSFYSMFKGVSKNREVLCKLFAPCLQQDLCYVMLDENLVVGFVAVSNCEKRAIVIDPAVFISVLGRVKGKMVSWQLYKILSTPEVKASESGYIDFLATAPSHRRKGVAARLLEFAEENMGFADLYLDVLESNTSAACLYQKLGYQTVMVKKSILMRLAGIKTMFVMKKTCGRGASDFEER